MPVVRRSSFAFRTRPLLGVSLLFLVVSCANPKIIAAQIVRIAPKASACDPAVVDAALEASDLKDAGRTMEAEIGETLAQTQATLRARGKYLPAGEKDRFEAMMHQAFAADAVDVEIQRSMKTHCEPRTFAAATEQLNTPLAKKFRGLESEFNRSHSRAAINRYAVSLQQRPPTATRESLIEALEKTVHEADFVADVDAQIVLAFYMAITSKATDDSQFGTMRDQLPPPIRREVRVQQLMTYRNAADEELDQYIMLLRIPDVQRFQTICKTAYQDAVVRRSQVLAAMLKQRIDEILASRHR